MKKFFSVTVIFIGIIALANAADEGWQSLFNGKDLTGWYVHVRGQPKHVDPTGIVSVTNGMIHMYATAEQGSKQPITVICTEKEFSDYDLRLEYKWGEKTFAPRVGKKKDAGLLYHCFDEQVWPSSVECQIQQGDTGDLWAVRTQVQTPTDPSHKAATYLPLDAGGTIRTVGNTNGPTRVFKNRTVEKDGWNTVEVKIRGASSVHIINGQTNNGAIAIARMINGNWQPLTKGRIALQAEYSEVFYRNIQLRAAGTQRRQ